MSIIVYTSIIKGKDQLLNVVPEEGVQYICFSDKQFSHQVWQYQPIEPLGQSDARRIARRYKILSHLYFPGSTTIWLDGRVKLQIPVHELLKKYKGDLCARPHPSRTCIYEEAAVIKQQNYDADEIVDRQMKMYKEKGYPSENGLNETGILIRRNSLKISKFNNDWWSIVSSSSKRDQLSFNPTAYYLDLPITLINRSDVKVYGHQIRTTLNS